MINPYEAAPGAGLRVWRVLADRGEGCRDEETEGGQEEGCPNEEMSPASSPMSMPAWRRLRARMRVAQL